MLSLLTIDSKMKKIVFLFFLTISAFVANAQSFPFNAPDYKSIKKSIENPSSEFYYPNLMERYQTGDSSLTREERSYLYYGYVFHPDYMPLDTSSYNNRLMETLSKESFTSVDYEKLIGDADALLKEDPFNLRALNIKLMVYAQQDNVAEYKKAFAQRKVVLDAIVSSGDGLSKKTPYYVINVSHEYDFLSSIGYQVVGKGKITGHYHYVKLGENKYGIKGLYFDITPVLEYMNKHRR